MKVFELMEQLSKMPAGAEIEFSTVMTVNEFLKGDQSEGDNNEVLYEVRTGVCEADAASEKRVFIYGN